jgi:beta-N-acetylhexosaminidase
MEKASSLPAREETANMRLLKSLKFRSCRLIPVLLACTLLTMAGCSGKGSDGTGGSSAPVSTESPPTIPAASFTPVPSPTSDPIRLRIVNMPLEEKIGQMILAGIQGSVLDDEAKRMITEDKVGGIILYAANITSLEGMVSLVNSIKNSNTANPTPLFISVDQEGGKVSRLPKEFSPIPSNGKVGSKNNAALVEEMGKLLARELTLTGFNVNFAPVLDVNSNPSNPVIGDRSFGSTPSLVCKLGIAEMKGLRSQGIIPVVKHFPGHGDTSVDSHLDLPVVNKTAEHLKKLELLPFEAAVKEQAEAVMVAHILYPKLDPSKPASLSEAIIGKLLREDMGYKGVVITDDLGMGAIKKHFNLADAAVQTVLAGSDILLVAHGYDNEKLVFDTLVQSVKKGVIPESRINDSVYRILSLKSKYKLTDRILPVPALTKLNADIQAWAKLIQS